MKIEQLSVTIKFANWIEGNEQLKLLKEPDLGEKLSKVVEDNYKTLNKELEKEESILEPYDIKLKNNQIKVEIELIKGKRGKVESTVEIKEITKKEKDKEKVVSSDKKERFTSDIFVTYRNCPKEWTKEFMFEKLLFEKFGLGEGKTKVAKYIILERKQPWGNEYDCLLCLANPHGLYTSKLDWSIADDKGNEVKGIAGDTIWVKKYFEMEKEPNKIGWAFIGINTEPSLRWERGYSVLRNPRSEE
jgi:hypothetical protein